MDKHVDLTKNVTTKCVEETLLKIDNDNNIHMHLLANSTESGIQPVIANGLKNILSNENELNVISSNTDLHLDIHDGRPLILVNNSQQINDIEAVSSSESSIKITIANDIQERKYIEGNNDNISIDLKKQCSVTNNNIISNEKSSYVINSGVYNSESAVVPDDCNDIESTETTINNVSNSCDVNQDLDENPLKSGDEEEDTISVHSSASVEVTGVTQLSDNCIDIYDSEDDSTDDLILHMEPQMELTVSDETINGDSTIESTQMHEVEQNGSNNDTENVSNEVIENISSNDKTQLRQTNMDDKENNNKTKFGKLRVRDICKQQDDIVTPVSEDSIVGYNNRPQRQATKKAESQIWGHAKKDDSVYSILKNVRLLPDEITRSCYFCDRVRFCKYEGTVNNEDVLICASCCPDTNNKVLTIAPLSAPTCSANVITVTASPLTTITSLPIVSSLNQNSITKSTIPFKPQYIHFKRKCSHCNLRNIVDKKSLTWELMDFCNEDCLGRYQLLLASHCAKCKGIVHQTSMGKYCVRFGLDIKQFCSGSCLEDFKKNLKTCGYCQKDLTSIRAVFSASIGEKGQSKDFCSENCMKKFNQLRADKERGSEYGTCSVCRNNKPVKFEMILDHDDHILCSEICSSAFKFANHIKSTEKCDTCKKIFDDTRVNSLFVYDEDKPLNFCSKMCLNSYILAKRRIIPCNWCKVKKYNFDMIKKTTTDGGCLEMCSLNCLTLYQVSVNASSTRKIKCDQCKVVEFAQYHLTMSDATIRNFCSYNCVMYFQSRYHKSPMTVLDNHSSNIPVPMGTPKRVVFSNKPGDGTSLSPAIIDITSYSVTVDNVTGLINTRISMNSSDSNVSTTYSNSSPLSSTTVAPQNVVKEKWLQQILAPNPTINGDYRNKMVQTRCEMRTVSTSCPDDDDADHSSDVVNRETDTSGSVVTSCPSTTKNSTTILPVPIYIPVPIPILQPPELIPVPLILPLPIPIFFPSSKKTFKNVSKELEIMKLQPSNGALEANHLMKAEKSTKEDRTEDKSTAESLNPDGDGITSENITPTDEANFMGFSTDTDFDYSSTSSSSSSSDEDNNVPVSVKALLNRNSNLPLSNESIKGDQINNDAWLCKKRKTTSDTEDNEFVKKSCPSSFSTEQAEKELGNEDSESSSSRTVLYQSDSGVLKVDVGLSAWNNWILFKRKEHLTNNQWDENEIKLSQKKFLELTAEELNYMLCLFVREISKSYEAEHLYYLCLSLQQHLIVEGRRDNIFLDPLYNRFTDTLNEEILKRLSRYGYTGYNCQIEEDYLWECQQLGAHSPYVLLSTIVYFNTKHLHLWTIEDHMRLSISSAKQYSIFHSSGQPVRSGKDMKSVEIYKFDGQLAKCPRKLYDFYISKCPDDSMMRNDVFYLQPKDSCLPDSSVWFSSIPMSQEFLNKILNRVKLVLQVKLLMIKHEFVA